MDACFTATAMSEPPTRNLCGLPCLMQVWLPVCVGGNIEAPDCDVTLFAEPSLAVYEPRFAEFRSRR